MACRQSDDHEAEGSSECVAALYVHRSSPPVLREPDLESLHGPDRAPKSVLSRPLVANVQVPQHHGDRSLPVPWAWAAWTERPRCTECPPQLPVQRIGARPCFVNTFDPSIALSQTLKLTDDGGRLVGETADVTHLPGSSLFCNCDGDRCLMNVESYEQMVI